MKKYNAVYRRLFIIYTAVLVVCVLTFDIYFTYYLKESKKLQSLYLNRRMIEDVEIQLIKNANSAERIMKGIYDQNFVANDLINLLNNDMTTYLKMKLDHLTTSELEFYNGIERYATQTFNTYKEVVNISFVSYSRQEMIKISSSGTMLTEPLERSFVEKLQNQSVLSNNGKIYYIKEISNPNDLKKEGLALITFNFVNIKEIIESYGSHALIIDPKGEVIYDSDSSDYDRNQLLEYVEKLSVEDKITIDNKTYLTNMLVDKLGNKVLGRVEYNKATNLTITYYAALIVLDLLVLGVSMLIIMSKLKNVNNKMNKIIVGMEEVKAGNLDVKIELSGENDELTFIAEQFNHMCIDLKRYIDQSYLAEMNKKEAELSKKEAEMSALQSKINPHFLYNTLESIRMKAIASGNRDVGRMLFLLGNLFRNQLKEDDIITIEKEINYCKEYLELFKYRYDDRFNYTVSCEEVVKNSNTIKFILQPLVENYIVHGIRREDDDNHLDIDVFKNGNNVTIIIKDNGIGIPLEKIKEINKKIKQKDFSGKSIGILNTHQRIIFRYGEEYGVKIDEEFKNGTKIIVIIPMREG